MILAHMLKEELWPVEDTSAYLIRAAERATSMEARMILLALSELKRI